jgi:putative aldouronate transport system permease protein
MVNLLARRRKIRLGFADRLFYVLITVFLSVCFIIVLLPLLHVVSHSVSSPTAVAYGKVWLFPVEFTLFAYGKILQDGTLITGLLNSVFYAGVGTVLNIVLTIMAAYPLSRKTFYGRNVIMIFFAFTMLFGGGMIPRFLLVKSLGLYNTRAVMILPEAIIVWYMILARTFFQSSIPVELYESAEIDGATDVRIILRVVVPLSGPIVAVLSLFYAVGHWNRYFDALIFLKDPGLYNLQLVLRNIMQAANSILEQTMDLGNAMRAAEIVEVFKYAVIVFAALPVLLLYPFIQRYFIKGVMIGSLKG